MARLETGQVGTFRGKVGQVVVSKWRDILVGKKTPTKSGKPATDDQQDQRSKFGLVTSFFAGMGSTIKLGFQGHKIGMTPMNACVKYHLDNAVTGVYPNYKMDYTKVIISNANGTGEIDGAFAPKGEAVADATVKISWTLSPRNFSKDTSPDDVLTVMFYSETRKKYVIYPGVAPRSDLSFEAQLPYYFRNDVCHAYIFFHSIGKTKAVSNSEYLGKFTILP